MLFLNLVSYELIAKLIATIKTEVETRSLFIPYFVQVFMKTWVLEIESLSKPRLRLKIPKRFELPQKVIFES